MSLITGRMNPADDDRSLNMYNIKKIQILLKSDKKISDSPPGSITYDLLHSEFAKTAILSIPQLCPPCLENSC